MSVIYYRRRDPQDCRGASEPFTKDQLLDIPRVPPQ